MTTITQLAENREFNESLTSTITPAMNGKVVEIGGGFTALAFRERDFSGAMDPLVMVDHYQMSESTFGAHPHAGLSAVSLIFEDSLGAFHNRDSLGNDFDLMPGDLYWLKAGAGIIHDESPRAGAKIHGLQVFVNLPAENKNDQPASLHVKAQDIPVIEENGARVRVVLGESNHTRGQQSPALPMTILDGFISAGADFVHQRKSGENVWLYAIKGELKLVLSGQEVHLSEGQSIAISAAHDEFANAIHLQNEGNHTAHFALFAANPIGEDFVQKGPFVMSTKEDIARVEADYAAGKLGQLDL